MVKLTDLLEDVNDFDLSDNPVASCKHSVFYFKSFEHSIDELKTSKDIKDFDSFCKIAMDNIEGGADADNRNYEEDPAGYGFDPPNSHIAYYENDGILTGEFRSDWESLPEGFLVIDKRAGELFKNICKLYQNGDYSELEDYINDLIYDV
jgi:hypothetical protein